MRRTLTALAVIAASLTLSLASAGQANAAPPVPDVLYWCSTGVCSA